MLEHGDSDAFASLKMLRRYGTCLVQQLNHREQIRIYTAVIEQVLWSALGQQPGLKHWAPCKAQHQEIFRAHRWAISWATVTATRMRSTTPAVSATSTAASRNVIRPQFSIAPACFRIVCVSRPSHNVPWYDLWP